MAVACSSCAPRSGAGGTMTRQEENLGGCVVAALLVGATPFGIVFWILVLEKLWDWFAPAGVPVEDRTVTAVFLGVSFLYLIKLLLGPRPDWETDYWDLINRWISRFALTPLWLLYAGWVVRTVVL